MARRKNLPESVRVKCALSERMREIRTELYGERGGSEMARRLGLPIRTWYNYEAGVTVPAEVLLRFVELTSVEPMWLLHGRGPRFRTGSGAGPAVERGEPDSVEVLLRTALERLERSNAPTRIPDPSPAVSGRTSPSGEPDVAGGGEAVRTFGNGRSHTEPARRGRTTYRNWPEDFRDCRCIQVQDDAMSPIVSTGAYVAFSDVEESAADLDGELVVAWMDGQSVVRWFEKSGRYGVLRSENPGKEPGTILIELEALPPGERPRRVLWISTPH